MHSILTSRPVGHSGFCWPPCDICANASTTWAVILGSDPTQHLCRFHDVNDLDFKGFHTFFRSPNPQTNGVRYDQQSHWFHRYGRPVLLGAEGVKNQKTVFG